MLSDRCGLHVAIRVHTRGLVRVRTSAVHIAHLVEVWILARGIGEHLLVLQRLLRVHAWWDHAWGWLHV